MPPRRRRVVESSDDDDAAEEAVPADGDRMDRYEENRLRDEAAFAHAEEAAHVVDDDVAMADAESDGGEGDGEGDGEGGDPGEDPADDDEVVEELDVFFNQAMGGAGRLYLLQFPLRAGPFPAALPPRSGRIKPRAGMLEVAVPLDTNSSRYDAHRGEELAEGATDAAKGKGKKLLDAQVYSSAPVPASATYMVGAVRGGALHLTPIHAAVQLRPNLAYLNKPKERGAAKPDGAPAPGEDQAGQGGGRLVQMSLRKTEVNENREENARRSAEALMRKQAEEEAWIPLAIHDEGSYESAAASAGLFVSEADAPEADVATTARTYLDEVAPRSSSASLSKVNSDGKEEYQILKGLSLADIHTLPLPEQLKCLMVNANIIRFSTLRTLVPSYYSDDRILEELPKVATLVQGCWVVRSAVVYRDRPAAARQVLLKMFMDGDRVSRAQLVERTHLPLAMATAMLQEIAVLVPGEGWELRTGRDEGFAREQAVLAAKLAIAFEKELAHAERELHSKPAKKAAGAAGPGAPRRQNSVGEGAKPLAVPLQVPVPAVGPTPPAPKAAPAPAAAPAPGVQGPKPPAAAAAKGKGKAPAAPAAAPAPVAKPADVTEYPQNPVPASDYPPTGTTANEQARDLVRRALLRHGVLRFEVIKSLLWARAGDTQAEGNELRPSHVTDLFLRSVLDELAVEVRGAYVLRRTNDAAVDPYRDIVVDLFRRAAGGAVRKAEVTGEVVAKSLSAPPPAAYQKIMKELAKNSGAVWTFKAGELEP
ncbi:Sin-like protein conserved region-domain-containing protein [Hyaloraphidium curvatum]|nr:Sin-like protein conserved region-domain-containing protein [Hyaloraphidium curvatum]